MEAKFFDDFEEAVECIRTHERVNGMKYKTRIITTGIGTGDVFRRMKNRSVIWEEKRCCTTTVAGRMDFTGITFLRAA